jgi:hypothetical protein
LLRFAARALEMALARVLSPLESAYDASSAASGTASRWFESVVAAVACELSELVFEKGLSWLITWRALAAGPEETGTDRAESLSPPARLGPSGRSTATQLSLWPAAAVWWCLRSSAAPMVLERWRVRFGGPVKSENPLPGVAGAGYGADAAVASVGRAAMAGA